LSDVYSTCELQEKDGNDQWITQKTLPNCVLDAADINLDKEQQIYTALMSGDTVLVETYETVFEFTSV